MFERYATFRNDSCAHFALLVIIAIADCLSVVYLTPVIASMGFMAGTTFASPVLVAGVLSIIFAAVISLFWLALSICFLATNQIQVLGYI